MLLQNPKSPVVPLLFASIVFQGVVSALDKPTSDSPLPIGWVASSPRDEIRPEFSYEPNGGPTGSGCFVIEHDSREGLDGWFQKEFPVTGGEYVQFQALRKLASVAVPRRSALVRVLWKNDAGKMVSADVPDEQLKELGHVPSAEPEHPVDGATDDKGWTTVQGIYRVPMKATRAVIELHLQWAPKGRAEWSAVDLVKTTPPASRKVRLATIHYKPKGKISSGQLRRVCATYQRSSQTESRSRRAWRDGAIRGCHRQIVIV